MGIPVIAIEKRRLSNVRKPNIVRFGQQSFFDISQFFYDDIKQANGLRYWRWGGRGQCLGAEKTRSQKNV
jgi:hypothetical protein